MTTINVPLKVELFVTFDTDGEQVTIDQKAVALAFREWLADLVSYGMDDDPYLADRLSDVTGWCVDGYGISYISYDVIES